MARMLCIKGKQHRVHTGLYEGRVYDVSLVKGCCAHIPMIAEAEGSVFRKMVTLHCKKCGFVRKHPKYVPWSPKRFMPLDDPKVADELLREIDQDEEITA